MFKTSHIKVLHIASGDLWAGAEAQLFTLATALKNIQYIDISVVVLNYGKLEQKLREAGIDVTVFNESELNGFQILHQLANKVKEAKPDVIHTHRVKENILGSIAARQCGNIPSLRTTHGASEHKHAWYQIPNKTIRLFDWFCGRFLQKKIIAVSVELAEILQKDFPANRIDIIENGIDLATCCSTTAVDYRRIKPDTGTDRSPIRVGIAGRLVPVKRVDLFIKAAAILFESRPELNIHFYIYGSGPLRTELETLSEIHNAGKVIHFEGHCENMQQKLASLDILLITSDHEGLPMVLLEAMAHKVAVIAHAVGGIPIALGQGDCGILVSEHQPSMYADAIYQLTISSEYRDKYTAKAFKRVTEYYSSETNANHYYKIYKQLLQRH